MKLNKTDELVVKTLKEQNKELTLQELTDISGENQKKIFRSLRKLFENELVETQARKYKLSGKPIPSSKGKSKNKNDEETEDLPET